MATIDIVSRALRATRDREPYLSERLALIKVAQDGAGDERAATALSRRRPGGVGRRRGGGFGLPRINPVETSPLRVGTSAGRGTRARNGLQNVARQHWQRGHKRSRRDARSPSAAVRDRMHLIESTSPYNPKLLLARALSESRHRETTRKGADHPPPLLLRPPRGLRAGAQQRLIDKHGVDLWDRITEDTFF